MDQNQFKGSWHEIKGEAKKKWGKLTDDDLVQCEGDYEKFLGAVQKHYGDEEKQSAQRWAEDWYPKEEQEEILRRHATTSRNQV